MRKSMFAFLMFFAVSMSVQAQSNFDKAAEFTANHICKCFNDTYKDMEAMLEDENGEKGKAFDDCLNSINAEMEKKFENLEMEPGFSEEMMFELMMKKLEARKECEFAYMIMQLGMGTEEEVIEEENTEDEGEE